MSTIPNATYHLQLWSLHDLRRKSLRRRLLLPTESPPYQSSTL